MAKKKKVLIILGMILGIIILVIVINFVPTFNLKTSGMKVLEGNYVDVYYETEEASAQDVFDLADSKAEEITVLLGFLEKQDVKIYIYDHQSTMQKKKYGLIGPLLGLDWYIGDNRGTSVLLTSPANPGKIHDYDTIKDAVLHEMVHAYVSVLNPDVQLWLTEGMALYLANGELFYKEYLNQMEIPSYSDIQTRNPIKFANMGGYTFAHTYIEFLVNKYGWDKVVELIKSVDSEQVLGNSDEGIYIEWVNYLENYYQ